MDKHTLHTVSFWLMQCCFNQNDKPVMGMVMSWGWRWRAWVLITHNVSRMFHWLCVKTGTVAQWLDFGASQQEVCGLGSNSACFCVESACFRCVYVEVCGSALLSSRIPTACTLGLLINLIFLYVQMRRWRLFVFLCWHVPCSFCPKIAGI